jgi:hypothetical protein
MPPLQLSRTLDEAGEHGCRVDEIGILAAGPIEVFAGEFEAKVASEAPGTVAETVEHCRVSAVASVIDDGAGQL